jgi:acetylornithine/succinyldiaminopimelate/putrescine aminotransferase
MSKVVNARGSIYYMNDGTKLIDGISGTYNVTYGHDFPPVATSICRHSHLLNCYGLAHDGELLGETLSQNFDGGKSRWFFYSEGAVAVEKAIMYAIERKVLTDQPRTMRILTLPGGFHGKTFGTLPFHYSELPYKMPYYLCEVSEHELLNSDEWEDDFDAFIVEPIRGWDGYGYGWEVLQQIRKWCDKAGALFIADEIVTGLGRGMPAYFITSRLADIILLGKGLGQGLPIAGFGISGRVANLSEIDVGWSTTTSSNPFCTAVAHDILTMLNEEIVGKSEMIGQRWLQCFATSEDEIKRWQPRIHGSMIFLNLGNSCKRICKALRDEHKIIVTDHSPWIKLMPHFLMEDDITYRIIEAIKKEAERVIL